MSARQQPSGWAATPWNSVSEGELRANYRESFERIRRDFEATGSGPASLSDRTRLVDTLSLTMWERHFARSRVDGVALLAVGGYGRSELFPHSDIDLLFVAGDDPTCQGIKDAVRGFCQELWDSGLRVSPATRTVGECARFDQENVEFTLSLLDGRLLAGEVKLFAQLHQRQLPELVARESDALLQTLSQLTAERHRRFGNTIFHLEPNLKDGAGGLRDCHVARWTGTISALASGSRDEAARVRGHCAHPELLQAVSFLSSARCFLHYRHNRDDNTLDWSAQEELALRGIGTGSGPASPAEWMRLYFRHAKAVNDTTSRVLAEVTRARSSLYRSFQHWRSRVSNSEFSVADGRAYFQQSADAREVGAVLRLFVFVAQHGVKVSADAERRISEAHLRLSETMPQGDTLWEHLREILTLPHGAEALRAMHSLDLLTCAVPEFEAINLLVLRDLYHRYTVDEHTFRAIEVLHQLKNSGDEWLRPFAQLLPEIERRDLLFLALLLHDTGKGLEGSDHVHGSLQLAQAALRRLRLPAEDAALVCWLIGNHLEISSTLRRRDIYDPATIAELTGKMGTPERLKMLTLLTLADIKAVNPEALTPWKAQNLWRLYMATAAYFDRSADGANSVSDGFSKSVEAVIALLPLRRAEILRFLAGLPARYVLSHPPEQVLQHFQFAAALHTQPVQLELQTHTGQYELTVVTTDRRGLFCTLAGTLYAWGLDITKAAAFSNNSGVVVDSLYFKDRFRTLELNPTERERLLRSISDILQGEAPLHKLLESRLRADQRQIKRTVDTRIRHDNESSERNTLLEVVTQDRPGLLHRISSLLNDEGCSIEVALIDTEGPLAHDVFYVTRESRKLTAEEARDLEWALAAELGDAFPTW